MSWYKKGGVPVIAAASAVAFYVGVSATRDAEPAPTRTPELQEQIERLNQSAEWFDLCVKKTEAEAAKARAFADKAKAAALNGQEAKARAFADEATAAALNTQEVAEGMKSILAAMNESEQALAAKLVGGKDKAAA